MARIGGGRPRYLSLCAGPGGYDEGMRDVDPSLCEETFGVELEPLVAATRRAAGHRTGCADITKIGPGMFGNVRGVMVSTPCPTLSAGGLQSGVLDFDELHDAIMCIGLGVRSDRIPARHPGCGCQRSWLPKVVKDHRTSLLTEALHWAFALRPRWLIFEQVPRALSLWEDMGVELECFGYGWVDVGILDAADFGAPQHRQRAILIAHATRPVRLPEPTHGPKAGRPYRTPESVLGLRGSLGFARRNDRPDGGLYRARDMRTTSRPSFTVTEKVRSWTYVPEDGSAPRKLTMPEISQLQTFRPDYPWQGSHTAKCLQVANAVPPALSTALLRVVLNIPAAAAAA